MSILPKAAIVMKVGPHSNMSLEEIIKSKQVEESIHGVHYWGYSGSFCQPKPTQAFCRWAMEKYGEEPSLILLETKSSYNSSIGFITQYSVDNTAFVPFQAPVQLQGACFSFVAKGLRAIDTFSPERYHVYGGKNAGKILSEHLRFRINKSFATLAEAEISNTNHNNVPALVATLVEPFAIWLRE